MSTVDLRGARWRKSSFSGDNAGENCVEVAVVGAAGAVRDSKNPGGAVLVLPARALTRLISATR